MAWSKCPPRRGAWHECRKTRRREIPFVAKCCFPYYKYGSVTVMSIWSIFDFETLQILPSKFTMEIDEAEDLLSGSGSSGYDLALFFFENDQFLEKYKCTICRKILRNTVQVSNNQSARRACRKCYTDNIRYVIFVIAICILTIFTIYLNC